MNRADWVLLLLAKDALGVEGPDFLNPIHIQKGMFLLNERGPERGIYHFRPHNWGPFSSEIYTDLDALVREGLVKETPMPGRTWSRYSATPEGVAEAKRLVTSLAEPSRQWLAQCRQFLTQRGFAQLLREVYAAYPDMAVKSHFAH